MKLAAITLACLCAFSTSSHADPLNAERSASVQGDAPAGAAADSMLVGVGLAYVPEYTGSDKSRLLPLPVFERNFSNGAFISTLRGIGIAHTLADINVSAALSYGGTRIDHKRNIFSGSNDLRGMGDIDGALQAVFNASYRFDAIGVSVGSTQNLSQRSHGATYTLGSSLKLHASPTDQLSLGLSADYGDRKYMQTYFGVTSEQSQRSGYRRYDAKAGFTNVGATLTWNHVIDPHWSVLGVAGLKHLTADAADSPLTKRSTSPVLMTSLIYKF